jgi:aspartyl-tRNA(Asn)/glutamyl-tRNA(Gln) amidotransferase subunit B
MRDVVNAGAVEIIEATVAAGATPAGARKWWSGEIARRANLEGRELSDMGITPRAVAELDGLVQGGRLNDSMARQVLDGVLAGEGNPGAVADARGLALVSDDESARCGSRRGHHGQPRPRREDPAGKVQAAGALIGQVMKAMKGKADAARIRELVLEKVGQEAQPQ